MSELADKEFAALMIPILLVEVETQAQQMWTCRYCGGQTWILSEVCDHCGVEDCEQGA